MTIAGTMDAPLDLFGGLVTDMAPADLPPGVSPDCADVAFLPGAVMTRPGLESVFAPLAGNPTVNYLKTFTTLNQQQRLLALDSLGNLWKEILPGADPAGPGTLAQIASGLALGARARSTTLFGREYIALSDGKFGSDLPRQYDDANFDRVSQTGPGAGPAAAADEAVSFNIAAAGAARSNNVVTITTTAAHSFAAGQLVAIAGVTDASFNGTFAVVAAPTATSFTYAQVAANAASGGGTAAAAGSIAAGVHKVAVIFRTRQGYLTAPSPAISWTAAGGKRVVVSGIPTGPANVTARILCFTGTGGASFYFIGAGGTLFSSNMVIADNTTTQATVDFSDTVLLAATNVDALFRLVELGESAGVISYASRLFWWGERNKQNNWTNLAFDGGWNAAGVVPLGWTLDPATGAGGSRESQLVAWGHAYRITGDGATAVRGRITQPAVQDAEGVARIAATTSYSVRARVLKGGGLGQGALHVQLFSASAGISTAGLEVTAAQAATTFAEFTAELTPPLATVPADLVLRVYADGTPTAGGFFVVDNIQIFPTAEPYRASLVRASRAEDPESYDGISGFLSVAENDGQAVRSAFRLRGRLYFAKEHSLYVTEDDAQHEPAEWAITEVSRVVGTPSVEGTDAGEDWAVIAARTGLYIFWGAEPVKISQEIQPLWDQINWAAGHTLWVKVDSRAKRILCGVPLGAAVSPNRILALDYRGLDDAGEIASTPGVHFSTFTGKLFAVGRARKWAPWTITANAAALAERADGTAQLFLASGAANGKIYRLSEAQRSDDGAPIAGYYTTFFFPSRDLEQAMQSGSHRKLFSYLAAYVEGAGSLSLTAQVNDAAFAVAQQPLALSSPALKDLELPLNLTGERVAFRFSTAAVGAWFKLQRFVPSFIADPWAPVRGGN